MTYPTAALPPRPSLSLLSDRAKALRKAVAGGSLNAIDRVVCYHPAYHESGASHVAQSRLSMRDAQLVVAREHGFDNWTELKRYVDSLRYAGSAPTRVGKAVPFFWVVDMVSSLSHYVDRLGFRMSRSWIVEGRVRWCWLSNGTTSLMLQQFETDGVDARHFEGRRGMGCVFAVVTDRDIDTPSLLDSADTVVTDIVDADGYVLRDTHAVLGKRCSPVTTIPILEVSNLTRSVAFYRDILGYSETEGASGTCRLRRDEAVVVLRQETTPVQRRGQGVTIYHMCHDSIAYYREVTARGGAMAEPEVSNGLWHTDIRDPDGWTLAFETPTDVDEETKLGQVEAKGGFKAEPTARTTWQTGGQ